jgi:hypothetical protein
MSPNVQAQKRKIDQKKERIAEATKEGRYQHPADLRYGVVTALGYQGRLRCWLTDPPGEPATDPVRHRLLARLRFIFDWISFLTPRSQLASSLATRIRAIEVLRDPFELAGQPLYRGNGEPFRLVEDVPRFDRESFFAKFTRVVDGPAVGTIVGHVNQTTFFLGVQRKLFTMAASQDFNEILSYGGIAGSVTKRLRCVVSRSRALQMGLEPPNDARDRKLPYLTFPASGTLYYTRGLAVFGAISIERPPDDPGLFR